MLNYFQTPTTRATMMAWAAVAVAAMSPIVDAAEIVLGSLTDRQHGVGGQVVALSNRVLEAPDAFFWADTAAVHSDEGFILSDTAPTTSCGMTKLGAADGTVTYRMEFPEGTSLLDIAGGSILVWCKAFRINFGDLVIPVASDLEGLTATADRPELQCSTGADMFAYDESTAEKMKLGSFVSRAHDVAGEVFVLSDRVLEVRNFVYDGAPPDAFFWADSNPVPSHEGFILSDAAPTSSCGMTKLGAADGSATYRLEFPEGTSIHNMTGGSLSVRCREFGANFGELVIPDVLEGVLPAAEGPELQCSTGADMFAYDESTAEKMELGSFVSCAHDVAGEVFVLSDRVLKVRNFVYEGAAPDAFFWADSNPVPSHEGFILSDATPTSSCGTTKLGAADGSATYRLEFPEGTSIHKITGGSLSVWCREFGANFGELVIPDVLEGVLPATEGPKLEFSESADMADNEDKMEIVKTPEAYNCEPLHEDMQVRWKVDGDDILFELVGFIEEDNYLGFGVSGNNERTEMIGADVVIGDLFDGEFRASPYAMNARSPCSNGAGVCPDVGNSVDVSGAREEGVTFIRYRRPLVATDSTAGVERSNYVVPGKSTHIAWAIGPVSADTGFPNFHSVVYPLEDVSIEFGRAVADNCDPLIVAEDVEEEVMAGAFECPVLRGVMELHATIGPSGGDCGYQAISGGRVGWGIVWYVNDLLLPVIEMERGTTYTFLVNGGIDHTDSANYNPMYLTTSISGGYAQLNEEDRAQEQMLAGLNTSEGSFEATALGPIYKYTASDDTQATLANGIYIDFFSTLDNPCEADVATVDAAARLEFTPDASTPYLLYYQCVTHRNLGWEIRIVDPPTAVTRDNSKEEEKIAEEDQVDTMTSTNPTLRGSETTETTSSASVANLGLATVVIGVIGLLVV